MIKLEYQQLMKGRALHMLTMSRKETILRVSRPSNHGEVREFLGSAGFCRLWIPGFVELARSLYEATRRRKTFLDWTPQMEKAFSEIKAALPNTPALALPDLPDVTKPFYVFMDEKKGTVKGVLMQAIKMASSLLV